MIHNLLTNWSVFRWVRLLFGGLMIFEAVNIRNYWLLIPGAVFIALALFNAGCERNNCAVPTKRR